VRGRHLLRLLPFLAAVACGPAEPTPSPSPTPDACASSPTEYATVVSGWWVPSCSLVQNIYNDPQKALGSPDAAGVGPDGYSGFVSLGFGGHVTVDMRGCITDRSGPDIRVYQAVGSEPVSVYVSLSPDGPFTLLEARKECGDRFSGLRHQCEFDLASGGVAKARYVRVEDGELYACPGDTVTEGADLDAVQAVGVTVVSAPELAR
jgi:hypothetical protein